MEPPGGGVAPEPSQPKVNTSRLPGLHLGDRARGVVPGDDRPAVLTAGAQLDAGRHRLPAPEPFRLGQKGKRGVRVERHEHRLLCGHVASPFARRRCGREQLELAGPKDLEGVAQRLHADRVEPVVAEPAGLASLHETCTGKHPQMLRDGRTRDPELCGELAYGLLACRQQLQEPPAVGLGQDSHEIGHDITLAETNTTGVRMCKRHDRGPGRRGAARGPGGPGR